MKKFVICIDRKAGVKTFAALEHETITARDIVEAMEIADSKWDDTVYLMQIMEKVGKTEKEEDYKVETYEAKLCRRSNGWHPNTKAYSEQKHIVKKCIAKFGEWYETKFELN